MPFMSEQDMQHDILTREEEGYHPNRCSPIDIMNNPGQSKMADCSPHQRLKNIALADMLNEFQDEGISSPPADLVTFNSADETSLLFSAECMDMNNDILDLTKPLPWDKLKKGNSSMSLDSLNDNYIESQDSISESGETNDEGEVCSCGENVSPACPVHRKKALLTEEIQRTCSTLVETLTVDTPDDYDFGFMKQTSIDEDDLGEDIFESTDLCTASRTSQRTFDASSYTKGDDESYCSASTSGSSKLESRSSNDTEDKDTNSSQASSTNSSLGSFRSIPSVHRSDLSSSPDSYDLLYKSFEAAVCVEQEEEETGDSEESPNLTPLESFNQASPKLQKALSKRQRQALVGVHSENERNEAKEILGQFDSGFKQQSSYESEDSEIEQKVTTFAQLAKTRKKPEVIQAPKSLTIKPTHWSELVANQDKKNCEKLETVDETTPDANTPRRPHSLAIQLRFITKPACRPTQTPEQGSSSFVRGVTRTISAPEGFTADGLPVEQQSEMTRTSSWGPSTETSPPVFSAAASNNLTTRPRFNMTKQISLPAQPSNHMPMNFDPCQSSTPQIRPTRRYSPNMDINANFTDDDLEDSMVSNSSPEMEFRIHDSSPRRQITPSEQFTRPRRCVSWSDYPYDSSVSPDKTLSWTSTPEFQALCTLNTTTFKKMATNVSPLSKPSSITNDMNPNSRGRSATVGSRVSLKDLYQRIEEENTQDLPICDDRSTTTWTQSSPQQKIIDVEKNSVGCQVSDLPVQEPFRSNLTKCDSFDSMLAQNGLHQSGPSPYGDLRESLSDNISWFTRPRSKTFLSLHNDPVRTLQNVRDVKYEPKVRTWLVDCNQTRPSRVTCEELYIGEQRPKRRLVRIENIADSSDVRYIRHRPLKPIHVVDTEYRRRKALEQLNALEAPTTTPPAGCAPPFSDFLTSDNIESLPPNLERYRHWLSQNDVQSQLPKETNQPFRERLSSESAADMHRVYPGNAMDRQSQGRPRSLVLASYCDDGIEALPPQEIPVSPRYRSQHDTVDMLRKRALVAAIDGAVDHILGHFAQAINKSPLEKVRLGDSQQTPNVGHIVLHYLCPAITDLLLDGLKPHMQSFIVGRVRTTVWTPVEATTRLGPGTRSLYELVSMLSKQRYLREPSMKTNAFIFGLLNTRNVEIWLEHIRSHPDIIRTLYEPEAFLSLCNTSTRQLFDKLLLALQPLAVLPFNLEYQFEYNHMQTQASAVREKQHLQAKYGRSHMHRQGSLKTDDGASGRFSFFGRSSKSNFTRSNSWTSSLSSSLGFGKTSTGQSSERGHTQSSEQSDSDRLLRTVNAPHSVNSAEEMTVNSADSTPTASTQSWSLDWIKSFVKASDQPEGSSRTAETTTPTTITKQSGNDRSSWGRFGASMLKAFVKQSDPLQQSIPRLPGVVPIEEHSTSPPTTPTNSPNLTSDWNKASPGSPMKALCHHVTMSPGELSFSKGDILTVDHQVDPDWLLCHHGKESGLVHIDYVQGFE